jgi:hypothetical protein
MIEYNKEYFFINEYLYIIFYLIYISLPISLFVFFVFRLIDFIVFIIKIFIDKDDIRIFTKEEGFREDSVLIDSVSFIQGIFIIKYNTILIILLIIFLIPRIIANVKNNNKYRLISSSSIIPILYIDIYYVIRNQVQNLFENVIDKISASLNINFTFHVLFIITYTAIILWIQLINILGIRYGCKINLYEELTNILKKIQKKFYN